MASNISFIVYQDSCPSIDFVLNEVKKDYDIEYSYILHDKDIEETGALKKPHYHLNLTLTWHDAKHCSKERDKLRKMFGGALVKSVLNLTGAVRYLAHLDDKDKYQYNLENIVFYGKMHKERLMQTLEYNTNSKSADTLLEDLFNYIDTCPIELTKNDIYFYLRKNRLFFKLSAVLKYVFDYLEMHNSRYAFEKDVERHYTNINTCYEELSQKETDLFVRELALDIREKELENK